VAGRAITSLLAPIERVAGYDTMMPYLRSEGVYMPSVSDVIAAARRTMAYS
jgi:pyruvate dehydrogenase E1 component beta subunit